MTPAHLAQLARYNRWANARLYNACARLSPAELTRTRPSFFGSILNTLNHGLLGDRLWMARFEGRRETEIVSLAQILHPDFEGLEEARRQMDDQMVAFFADLTGNLELPFRYRSMVGDDCEEQLGWCMLHMFNHATHHRGQVHDMLSATEIEPPPLDLIYFLRDG